MESVSLDSPEEVRNWLELPADVLYLIFMKLGAIEVLVRAQAVCSSWRKLSRSPQLWRCIDMREVQDYYHTDYDVENLEKMALNAIDRSDGQLIEFSAEHFTTDKVLERITDKSSPLRCLRLVSCYKISDEGLMEAAKKLPLLEELQLSYCSISEEALEAVGNSCPQLKSFRLNCHGYRSPHIESNEEAHAISKSMPELRHLHLFGNKLNNDGLQAILDGCLYLESLDLRQCFNVDLAGDLGKRCGEMIRHLRPPNDSTDDYELC
ncbi:PREDICTED: putative F-box/LRR-repeat protein 23 isoform X2 [Nelumbo nucifera]|uniref:F-box/LRR-repeat protein 23 isoform X2 n=1 Tax=Nelumbo nucifera TaxID=4432 RepID=A0A1U8AVB7_NELNU|nr:PREDICTED: putative F-box/LRR-repeat protein 23 isoform X2 [Nelumbo nucifera]